MQSFPDDQMDMGLGCRRTVQGTSPMFVMWSHACLHLPCYRYIPDNDGWLQLNKKYIRIPSPGLETNRKTQAKVSGSKKKKIGKDRK